MKPFPYFLLLAYLITLPAIADGVRERFGPSQMQRQFTVIEQLTDRAQSGSDSTARMRYRFDYPRLADDLARVRQGINEYLSPSRAQPADLVELTSDYRAEAVHTRPSDEHD
ncbi:RAQPRD family integrative conjugative element protein [Pseudomonas putida]|uniref:integrative conjugative element protein, RAQPRD family n=1 Tax=Pseudomonas putida TaxID=303 RepID=UPI0039DFBF6E